ncbi:MAG: hypothetical protein ACLT8O_02230 [Blautia massiliensis (ex Durand et al. 2017)]
MAKKIRNFAAILAISAVVGTILLILVFLLPVGPYAQECGEKCWGYAEDR